VEYSLTSSLVMTLSVTQGLSFGQSVSWQRSEPVTSQIQSQNITKKLGKKPDPVQICPTKISHKVTQD
jgi:hypothetical protein